MGAGSFCCKREKEDGKVTDRCNETISNESKEITQIQVKNSDQPTSKYIIVEPMEKKVEKIEIEPTGKCLKDIDIELFENKEIILEFLNCLKEALVYNRNNRDRKENIFILLTEDCIYYDEKKKHFYCSFKDIQINFKQYTKSLKVNDECLLQINPKIVSLSATSFKEREIRELDGSEYMICHSIGMLYLKYVKKHRKEKLIKLNKKIAKNDIPDIDNLDMQEYLLIHMCFMDISNSDIEETETKLSLIISKYKNNN